MDGEVRNLHYIVDKPWSRRIGSDGIAGHLGKDGLRIVGGGKSLRSGIEKKRVWESLRFLR
jgi:hypothetical protein